MPQNVLACDREQSFLLPPDVREWLPAHRLGVPPSPREHHLVGALGRILQLPEDRLGDLVGVHERVLSSSSGRRMRLSAPGRPAPAEVRRARNSAIVMSAGMSQAS